MFITSRVTAVGIGVGGHTNAWPNLLAQTMNQYVHHRQSNHRVDTPQSNAPVKSRTRARFEVANRAKGGTTSVWALTRLNALLGRPDNTPTSTNQPMT